MPIVQTQTISPLSRDWTYEQIASEAMVLTNTIDNERVQLINVRNHINVNISYLARLMNLSNSPWYSLWLEGEFETGLHPSGLEWIDLTTAVGTITPYNLLHQIERITTRNTDSTELTVNCIKQDMSQLGQINSNLNIQYRHSILWTHLSTEILFYVGERINTTNKNLSELYDYDLRTNQKIIIWAKRKPALDDLLSPNTSTTYRTNIDLPDDNVQLLIQLTQKKILEQINLEVPQVLDQEINQGIMQVQGNLAKELEFEKAEREKRKYGHQQSPPGAM